MASRSEWETHVQRWVESDLTAREFAAEVGVNPRTLVYWKWKLKQEGKPSERTPKRRSRKGAAPTPPTFVELSLPALAPKSGLALEVGGVTIRVEREFDEALLVRVVSILERR